MNLPDVVTRDEWREARLPLLEKEKVFTRARDALNAERRRLPMVEIEKDYVFQGPNGPARLLDLFEDRRQLIVYHFMFGPDWDEGCPACSYLVDNMGHPAHLHARNTSLALVARAPREKLDEYKHRMGWTLPWYSSLGSDFNYDFNVTIDNAHQPIEYNYKDMGDAPGDEPVEGHGVSVFLRDGGRVFHTYSTYARGVDLLLSTNNYLDLTPLGRQEDWEEPAGRSDGPMMNWLRRHDEYEEATSPALPS